MAGVMVSPSLILPTMSYNRFYTPMYPFRYLQCNSLCPLKLSTFSNVGFNKNKKYDSRFTTKTSVGNAEYVVESGTNVKFQTTMEVSGCSESLVLLGTGFREKVFAIIGVKVYAAAVYVNPKIAEQLTSWKGKTAAQIQDNSSLFTSMFEAPSEKSLQIVLVRDVDGKTFWDALDAAVSPRIKSPTPIDESSLSTFFELFQGRYLKQGTIIFMTWLEPTKMLVSISSDGYPSSMDATIESRNVALALFDVFHGDAAVSPSLKSSICNGLANMLK